jgi:hypothetical protein
MDTIDNDNINIDEEDEFVLKRKTTPTPTTAPTTTTLRTPRTLADLQRLSKDDLRALSGGQEGTVYELRAALAAKFRLKSDRSDDERDTDKPSK